MHQTIKKVSDDVERLGFNTAIASLMVYTNALEKREAITREEYEVLLRLLAPFAPHVTDELWSYLGHAESIHTASWPEYDSAKLEDSSKTIAVQINGKVRTTITLDSNMEEGAVKAHVLALPAIKKWLNGAVPKRVIIIPGKIVNIVI